MARPDVGTARGCERSRCDGEAREDGWRGADRWLSSPSPGEPGEISRGELHGARGHDGALGRRAGRFETNGRQQTSLVQGRTAMLAIAQMVHGRWCLHLTLGLIGPHGMVFVGWTPVSTLYDAWLSVAHAHTGAQYIPPVHSVNTTRDDGTIKKRAAARFSRTTQTNQRLSIAGTSRTGEPTNSWRGRPIFCSGSAIISFHCAIQPIVRAIAKMPVNSETGMPRADCTMPE